MKFIFKVFLIIVICYFLQGFFPWWIGILAAFIVNMIFESTSLKAFFCGFTALGILWGSYAWYIDHQTAGVLSEKVRTLFSLPASAYLIALTALIGALAGGVGALCGITFRRLFTYSDTKNISW